MSTYQFPQFQYGKAFAIDRPRLGPHSLRRARRLLTYIEEQGSTATAGAP